MSRPEADEPHDIADTQMFRRFVEQEPAAPATSIFNQKWMWVLIAVVILLVIVLITNLATR